MFGAGCAYGYDSGTAYPYGYADYYPGAYPSYSYGGLYPYPGYRVAGVRFHDHGPYGHERFEHRSFAHERFEHAPPPRATAQPGWSGHRHM
jgi:hypothetical protein